MLANGHDTNASARTAHSATVDATLAVPDNVTVFEFGSVTDDTGNIVIGLAARYRKPLPRPVHNAVFSSLLGQPTGYKVHDGDDTATAVWSFTHSLDLSDPTLEQFRNLIAGLPTVHESVVVLDWTPAADDIAALTVHGVGRKLNLHDHWSALQARIRNAEEADTNAGAAVSVGDADIARSASSAWIENGYTRMYNRMIVDNRVSVTARLLYQCIAMHAGQKSYAIVGQQTLSGYLGLKVRRTYDFIKELENCGWITTYHRGKKHANRYELLHPVPMAKPQVTGNSKKRK